MTKHRESDLAALSRMLSRELLEEPAKLREVVVTLKSNGENFELQIGPKWFTGELTWTFTKGDKLDVTGWKVDSQGVIEVVVRKITRGEWNLEPQRRQGSCSR